MTMLLFLIESLFSMPHCHVVHYSIMLVSDGGIPDEIDKGEKVNLLTLRVQNNRLSIPVSRSICELDVNLGEYELVELGVDCQICNGCTLCKDRCY